MISGEGAAPLRSLPRLDTGARCNSGHYCTIHPLQDSSVFVRLGGAVDCGVQCLGCRMAPDQWQIPVSLPGLDEALGAACIHRYAACYSCQWRQDALTNIEVSAAIGADQATDAALQASSWDIGSSLGMSQCSQPSALSGLQQCSGKTWYQQGIHGSGDIPVQVCAGDAARQRSLVGRRCSEG